VRGSLKIGSVGRVPIRVHWSFSLLLLLLAYDNSGLPSSRLLWTLLWVGALFASVTVHELAHCAVARRRGLAVKSIILLPIGGVSQISGLGASPRTERDVAIAGPLASAGLGIACGLLALSVGGRLWPPALLAGSWFTRLAWLNLTLAAFNLLPALPMDGGRVLRAVLAQKGGTARATSIAATVAQAVGAGMIAFGVLAPDWWLLVIGAFVMVGAQAERQQGNLAGRLTGLKVGHVMTWDPTAVPASVTSRELAPWMASFPGRALPVVDGEQYVGMLRAEDLVGATPSSTAGRLCDRGAPSLDVDADVLPGAMEAFGRTTGPALVVLSGGRVAGVLYRSAFEVVLREGHRPGRPVDPLTRPRSAA
jgi:Zn-dependent protease